MNRLRAILWKEWLELRQDRNIIFGTLIPPLIFTVLPLIVAYAIGSRPPEMIDRTSRFRPSVMDDPALAGMNAQEMAQALIAQQLSILFLLMPIVIPSVIASYAVVGEKVSRTLEPVLASPVRVRELMLGKILAALVPAVAITWGFSALFIAGMAAVSVSGRVFAAVVSPAWLLLLLCCTPLIALIVIAVIVGISSRVNDPRTAQQLSTFLVIPFVLFFVGQASGALILSPRLALVAAVVLLGVTALAMWAVTRFFQREVVLTRWR